MQTGIAFCFAKNISGNKFVGSYSMGKLKLSIRIKNIIHIYKITFFCYNEIYFSELFYSFGDDIMATLKKQRRIDTDNRIKAAAVEVFAEYGYERAQLSYMSKIAGR